jgi:hypothetical protein
MFVKSLSEKCRFKSLTGITAFTFNKTFITIVLVTLISSGLCYGEEDFRSLNEWGIPTKHKDLRALMRAASTNVIKWNVPGLIVKTRFLL